MESLSQYHIFYTVAKNGSISAAANELFISQPAVSKSIKKLEELLQTTLLIRGSRGVKCTEDGRILYEHLASAFSAIHEGEQMLQRGSLTLCLPLDFHNPLQHSPLRLIFLSNFCFFSVLFCTLVV